MQSLLTLIIVVILTGGTVVYLQPPSLPPHGGPTHGASAAPSPETDMGLAALVIVGAAAFLSLRKARRQVG